MYHIILTIAFIILMIPGIFAVFMFLPGVPYIFIVALIYTLLDHFAHVSGLNLFIVGSLAIASLVVDQLAGLLGAKWGGARGKTFLYAFIGAIVGNLLTPIIGGFIGLFAGIFLGEMYRRREHKKSTAVTGALKAATAGVIGSATGVAINTILAVASIGLFCWFVFF